MKKFGFAINDSASGHGIGRDFHRSPWILHHSKVSVVKQIMLALTSKFSENDEPGVMMPGHCFTIEVR